MPSLATNGYYYIRRSMPGFREGRFEISTGTQRKTEAENLEHTVLECYRAQAFDLLGAVKDGELELRKLRELVVRGGVVGAREALAELQIAGDKTRLAALVDRFAKDQRYELARRTLEGYLGHLRNGFCEWIREGYDEEPILAHLTTELIRNYRDDLIDSRLSDDSTDQERGRKRATANRHVNSIGAFCTWLERKGLLKSNPTTGARWSTKKENPAREETYRYLDAELVRLLIAEARAYDAENHTDDLVPNALWIRTLVATGVTTYTEGSELSLKSLDLRGPRVHGMVGVLISGTKSQYRKRHVWIPEPLALDLSQHARRYRLGRTDPFFPFVHDDYLPYWADLRERLIEAGHLEFEGATPYCLRHTFAVAAVRGNPEENQAGVDILELMRLLGHNRLETTRIYARHRADHAPRALSVSAAVLGV